MKQSAFILLNSLVFLSACGASQSHTTSPNAVTPAMTTHAQNNGSNSTHESLEQGRQLFTTKCNTCHALPDVHSEGADEWPKIMKEMGKNAKLTEEQSQQVLRFILTAREEPKK